jgi:hypothetical protein
MYTFTAGGNVLGFEMDAKRFTGPVEIEWPNFCDQLGAQQLFPCYNVLDRCHCPNEVF